MGRPTLQQLTSREVRRVLSVVGWSDTTAMKKLGLKNRRQIQRYKSGESVTPLARLEMLAQKANVPITLLIGHDETASSQYWARRLREDADAVIALLDDPSEMEAVEAAAAETLPPLPGAEGADPGQGDGAASAGHERKHDR